MFPDCWTPACVLQERAESIAGTAAESAAEAVMMTISTPIVNALRQIFTLLFSWLLVPSVDLVGQCSPWLESGGGDCALGPSEQLRRWMLPVTGLVLLGGLIWQGLLTSVTRKGQPLLQAGKGLVTAAVWGVVGIAGTQLALQAGDQYSCWIISRALDAGGDACDPNGIANQLLVSDSVDNLAQMLIVSGSAPFLIIVFGLVTLVIVIVQIVLMVFREASIVLLAGMLQLAAAGVVTRGTSGWFQKVPAWMLTLLAYKPVVSTVYAASFLMLGGSTDDGTAIRYAGAALEGDAEGVTELRWIVMGLAVLVMSIIALPMMMKFFSWTVGQERAGGGGGQAMAGAAMSAMYALGSRGAGGTSASDQARATDASMPTPGSPGGAGGASGAVTPPALPAGPSGGAAGGTAGSGAGAGAAEAGAAGAGAGGAGAAGATAGGAGAAGAAGGGATAAGAGAAAGAAGGPVGIAAMAVIQGGQMAASAVKQKGSAAMEGGG